LLNVGSLATPLALDQLATDLQAFSAGLALITETWFKPTQHLNSVIGLPGYVTYRLDRPKRIGGGVAIYAKSSISAKFFNPSASRGTGNLMIEILWVTFSLVGYDIFVAVLYHPPQPLYPQQQLLAYLETVTDEIVMGPSLNPIILIGGDFNQLPDSSVLALGYVNLVKAPTHKGHELDRLYVTQPSYSNVKVVKSSVTKTLHSAIVATADNVIIEDAYKQRIKKQFSLRTPAKCASFLSALSRVDWAPVSVTPLQFAFDFFYSTLSSLFRSHFPPSSVTLTSRDPPLFSPHIKAMLRRKNHLMRRGHIEQAGMLAERIGKAVVAASTRHLRFDSSGKVDSKLLWKEVNSYVKKPLVSQQSQAFSASDFNRHYASVSTDNCYEAPTPKHTCIAPQDWPGEFTVFAALDKLKPTSAGPDNIPFWVYKLGAPLLASPLSCLFQRSLSSSFVPTQWLTAVITPVPKIPAPLSIADYRPLSQTPLLSRLFERLVVRHYFYPVITDPQQPAHHLLADQFAFRPTGSTTASIITLLDHVTDLLETESFVRVISFDFTKAFDSVRLSTLFTKLSSFPIPDFLFNWLIQFFTNRSHSTLYNGLLSAVLRISASIVQGSVWGPFAYIVDSSDLRPVSPLNRICKYADDTYLLVPGSSSTLADSEVQNVSDWAVINNLVINKTKCKELIFYRKTQPPSLLPPLLLSGIGRFADLKVLGVTLQCDLSMDLHIRNIVTRSSQFLYALRVLRAHGLSGHQLHLVCRAYLGNSLSYAMPAWRGFARLEHINRLQKILNRAHRWGLDGGISLPTIDQLADRLDRSLFRKLERNPAHVLHPLLPPPRPAAYTLRDRVHNHTLSVVSASRRRNFIKRLLFLDVY